jgi:hypothetical protein
MGCIMKIITDPKTEIVCPECHTPLQLMSDCEDSRIYYEPRLADGEVQFVVVDAEADNTYNEIWICPEGHEIPEWMFDYDWSKPSEKEQSIERLLKFDSEEEWREHWGNLSAPFTIDSEV